MVIFIFSRRDFYVKINGKREYETHIQIFINRIGVMWHNRIRRDCRAQHSGQ